MPAGPGEGRPADLVVDPMTGREDAADRVRAFLDAYAQLHTLDQSQVHECWVGGRGPFVLYTADLAVLAEDRVAAGADEAGDDDQDEPEGHVPLEDLDDPDDSEDRGKQQQHGSPPTRDER